VCITCLTPHSIKCFIIDSLVPKSEFLFLIKQNFPNQTIFTICETRGFIIVSTGAGRLSLSRDSGSIPILPSAFNLKFTLLPNLRLRFEALSYFWSFTPNCCLHVFWLWYIKFILAGTQIYKRCACQMESFNFKNVTSTVWYRDALSEVTHLRPLYSYSNVN
jgi:hypothetical protein